MSKIKYRVLKDYQDREGKRVYAENEIVELEHDEANALVNRGILTRKGAEQPPEK
jgi:hypothetical protein